MWGGREGLSPEQSGPEGRASEMMAVHHPTPFLSSQRFLESDLDIWLAAKRRVGCQPARRRRSEGGTSGRAQEFLHTSERRFGLFFCHLCVWCSGFLFWGWLALKGMLAS